MNNENITLTRFFKNIYNGEIDGIPKGYIPATSVAKAIFRLTYKSFITEKIMIPIEQLPTEEKKELVDECRKTGEFFTNETLTEKCKALYVIKTINENT